MTLAAATKLMQMHKDAVTLARVCGSASGARRVEAQRRLTRLELAFDGLLTQVTRADIAARQPCN